MSDKQELRRAASIISELLVSTLRGSQRQLFDWEENGLQFLSDQWKVDPETMINDWAAARVREFEAGEQVRLMPWP